MRYLSVACSIVVGALTFAGPRAHAQSYPTKPIRVIVPFAAGGAVDALARLVTAKLQEAVGQPVIVENRAGAGGNTGADQVAKSPPDGYTILQNTNGQAISPALYRSLPFDPLKDFIPVTQLVGTSTVLVANPKLPAKSLKELIALAKAKPGKLNYGMTGVGNSLHLTMEMLKRAAGIDILAIPYRGDAPLNTALIAGEVDVAIVPIGTAVPLIEGGQIARAGGQQRPALAGAAGRADRRRRCHSRTSRLPAGRAISCPAQDAARRRRAVIQRETAKVIADPDMQARLKAMGNEPVGSTTEAFDATIQSGSGEVCKSREGSEYPDAGLIQNCLGEYGMRPLTLICALAVVFGLSAPRASRKTSPASQCASSCRSRPAARWTCWPGSSAASLQEAFRQPVIVENRPGAGGNLGADLVAKSPPDGYTILLTPNGQAISPSLYRNLPYDGRNDLTPVTQLVASNLVLVASPKSSITSVRDLIAQAKAKPGKLNYGSSGVGNPLHLTMEMFKHAAGIEIVAIPYKSDAEINTSLISGDMQVAVVPLATARQLIEDGQLRALGVTGARRATVTPDIPTVAESGVPGFESASWQGFFVAAQDAA